MADYSQRQHFCLALAAPLILAERRDPRELFGWDRTGIARARGEDSIIEHSLAFLAPLGIATRPQLLAWTRDRLRQGTAKDLSRVVAAIGAAVWAGIMTDDDGWQVILVAGKLAQQGYGSWDAFGAACDGDVEPARAVWAERPWQTDLQVTLVDAASHVRVLAASCPTCSAPRTRPSPTAYVYCDACGALMDYDVAVAFSVPMQQPGPIYERLRTQLALELAATRERGDADAYRTLQRRLFEAWVEACPTSVPVRTKDADYRARYVAWLAEAQVIADLDSDARAREIAMHTTVGKLQFISSGTTIRVPSDKFRALSDAMFDYEARRDELYVERGLYALHPDGASRELQRRIGFSLFVQAWLPMLEPDEGSALLARTDLKREYTMLPLATTQETSCTHCGGPLELVAGARRVVCDHCGRLVDFIGR